MNRTARSAIALAAATALAATAAVVAHAAPIDIGDDPIVIPKANTLWESMAWDSRGFVISEATLFATGTVFDGAPYFYQSGEPNDPYEMDFENDDAFDGALAIFVSPDEATPPSFYGMPDDYSYEVDLTSSGGDTVIQGPPEVLSGLRVSVQQRYYAAGDLARAVATYTNPTAAPITVVTGAHSNYGSDDDTVLEGDSSGDGNVSEADRWIITGDDGAYFDPIVTTAWAAPGASKLPDYAGLADPARLLLLDESTVAFLLTVQPGQTVHLGYFVKVHGFVMDEGEPAGPTGEPFSIGEGGELAAAAVIADTYAAAVAAAVADAAEFSTFTGRLTAGLAPGTVVLNWGTVPAAPAGPATPVPARPSFTG